MGVLRYRIIIITRPPHTHTLSHTTQYSHTHHHPSSSHSHFAQSTSRIHTPTFATYCMIYIDITHSAHEQNPNKEEENRSNISGTGSFEIAQGFTTFSLSVFSSHHKSGDNPTSPPKDSTSTSTPPRKQSPVMLH